MSGCLEKPRVRLVRGDLVAAEVGRGDAEIGKSVFEELWSSRAVADGRSEDFIDWVVKYVEFYRTDELPDSEGIELEDEYAPTEDEWEKIEDCFARRGKTALEVQFVDGGNRFGYGVAVYGHPFAC